MGGDEEEADIVGGCLEGGGRGGGVAVAPLALVVVRVGAVRVRTRRHPGAEPGE